MSSLDNTFHYMCILLGKRLQEIGLIPKDINKNKLLTAAYTYCPHHVSHYLGMDVHDTGKISRSINIQPGMIITIEPGTSKNFQSTHIEELFVNLYLFFYYTRYICEPKKSFRTTTFSWFGCSYRG